MNKTLLLASSGPGLHGVGGVLIHDMLHTADVEPVTLAAIVTKAQTTLIDRSRLIHSDFFDLPDEFCEPSRGTMASTVKKLLARRMKYDAEIKKLVSQLRLVVHRESPQQIWAILNGTAIIDTLYLLLPDIQCDLLLQVWDDPTYLALRRRLDMISRRRTTGRFNTMLRRAKRVAVIGEEMAAAYSAQSQGKYVIIRHGFTGSPVVGRSDIPCPGEFRIGLSGSMYCPSAWKSLQKSLDLLGWRIDGRQVVLEVVGGKIEFTSRAKAACRFWGWRPHEEVTRMMAGCDLLYLPQAFEKQDQLLTRLSFPTKLSTYSASGRPVFIHTPEYGSLTRFCRQHEMGVLCHSLEPALIAAALQQFENPQFRAEQAASTARIGASVLTKKNFDDGVRTFLGIDGSQPAPVWTNV